MMKRRGIIFILFLLCFSFTVSAVNVTYDSGLSLTSSQSGDGLGWCWNVYINESFDLLYLTKQNTATPDRCELLSFPDYTIIGSEFTFTGDNCYFTENNTLTQGNWYSICVYGTGSWTDKYLNNPATYPTQFEKMLLKNETFQGSGHGSPGGYTTDATYVQSIVSVTIDNSTISPNFQITAKDNQTLETITIFNATVNGTFYSTTNGTINTLYNDVVINVTVNANLFEPVTLINYNVTNNLGANLTKYYYHSVNYSSSVIETEQQTISFRVNVTDSVVDIDATLLYNTTMQSVIKNTYSDYYEFTSTFLSPDVSSPETVNFTWFYNVTTNFSIEQESNITPQNIVLFGIDNCSVYSVVAINFSLRNDTESTPIVGDFAGYMDVYIDSISQSRQFNLTWAPADHFAVCIDPEELTLLSEGQFEYSASGYVTETYYLVNQSMNNVSQTIDLYLTTSASTVTFTVTDPNDDPVQNAYVHILRYELTTNSFHTTEIIKTDTNGQALGNINLINTWYKFFVYLNGVLVLEESPSKLVTTTKNFRINTGTDFFSTLDHVEGSSCALSYNNNTRTSTLVFSNSGGTSQQYCVDVKTLSGAGQTLVNTTCLTSASGSINVVNSPVNKSIIISSYVVLSGTNHVCGTPLSISYNKDFETYGESGLFAVIFLQIAILMIFLWSPVAAIVGLLVVTIGSVILGVAYLSWASIISLIIMGGIVIMRSSRE